MCSLTALRSRCGNVAAIGKGFAGTLEDRISHAMQSAASPAICQTLQHQGFAVVDGALGPALCTQLREEIKVWCSPGCPIILVPAHMLLIDSPAAFHVHVLKRKWVRKIMGFRRGAWQSPEVTPALIICAQAGARPHARMPVGVGVRLGE
jgi:hypothetical protein